jgi:protein-tyrosine-phosphatase
MPSVLFVCVANSFRSQIAEAAARAIGGTVGVRNEAYSLGTAEPLLQANIYI